MPLSATLARRPFERVSLARQFLIVSAIVLALCVAGVGTWMARGIEAREVTRAAETAALFVESLVAAPLQELARTGALSAETKLALDAIFAGGPLQKKVVRFKLWTVDGFVHYSNDSTQTGRRFPLHDHQAFAFMGQMHASVSELDGPDNAAERAHWKRLIEIYVPLRVRGGERVEAVAEFYQVMDDVEVDIREDQRQSWTSVSFAGLLLFSGLYALVHRASLTIRDQQSDLTRQLIDLRALLDQNRAMNARLQRAGAMTTSMSERALRRVAADLHDGPTQDLALALLTLDELWGDAANPPPAAELERLRQTLKRSMTMLRDIAGGLGVPGLSQLSLADVVRRAASDAAHKAGVAIETQIDDALAADAPEAVKITTYRIVQEALSNSLRHAAGHPPRVAARRDDEHLIVEVADDGPGFDTTQPTATGHLGLAFLSERVRLLGGSLQLRSAPDAGTTLQVRLPLAAQETADA